jgi:antitoxin ParD1/3/4
MPNVEKISIALTPEMAAAVRAAVANGEYVSSSEVVREALRDWQLRRALHQKELEELRHVWQEGIASGPGHLADMQAIKAEARRRFEQANAPE